MKKSTALILVLAVISILGLWTVKTLKTRSEKQAQEKARQEEIDSRKNMSDARATKGKIVIAVDDWVGYFPLRSERMKQEFLKEGYLLICHDDKADYSSRIAGLKDGSLDLAVGTVDSFILSGAPDYPATIVTVLDESKGGDAIVSYIDEVPSLDALRTNVNRKIAFTPNSPSHQLIKAAGVDFDIPVLSAKDSTLKIPTVDSRDAFEKLKRHEVSVAVLWEPQVSKALEIPGVQKLLGSEKTSRVIVDVLLGGKSVMVNRPDAVNTLLKTYFKVLRHYREFPEDLERELATEQRVDPTSAAQMIRGVKWVNLTENAHDWFGVDAAQIAGTRPRHALIETIDSVISILRQVGDFDRNPLPDGNPLMITNSGFIEELYVDGVSNGFANVSKDALDKKQNIFTPLSNEQWATLRDVGTLKVEPIKFQSGTDGLTLEGKESIDEIAGKMKHYPSFRIGIRGHTDVQGDPDANAELSLTRAQSVEKYLELAHGIEPNRMRAEGLGGTKPLRRLPGESNRAYSYRLPRVEIVLLLETL